MDNVTFRITGDYPDGFIRDMRLRHGMTLMVREDGDKCGVHYHGYCSQIRINTLRSYLKKHFKGNGQYQCKKAGDDDAALRYLCKGVDKDTPPDIRFNDGHLVDEYHTRYWDHNKMYKLRARGKGEVLDRCYEDIEEEIGYSTERDIIGGAIIRWYDESGKRMPARFAMDTMISTYIVRQNKKQDPTTKLTYVELYRQLYG